MKYLFFPAKFDLFYYFVEHLCVAISVLVPVCLRGQPTGAPVPKYFLKGPRGFSYQLRERCFITSLPAKTAIMKNVYLQNISDPLNTHRKKIYTHDLV